MAQGRRHSSSEIAALLKKIKGSVARGERASVACSQAGISEQTYYRWCAEFGDLNAEQISRIQFLEQEAMRLRRSIETIRLEHKVEAVDNRTRPRNFRRDCFINTAGV